MSLYCFRETLESLLSTGSLPVNEDNPFLIRPSCHELAHTCSILHDGMVYVTCGECGAKVVNIKVASEDITINIRPRCHEEGVEEIYYLNGCLYCICSACGKKLHQFRVQIAPLSALEVYAN